MTEEKATLVKKRTKNDVKKSEGKMKLDDESSRRKSEGCSLAEKEHNTEVGRKEVNEDGRVGAAKVKSEETKDGIVTEEKIT